MRLGGKKGPVESGRAAQGFSAVPNTVSCDVVIVGLGPVGAALAALLGARGVSVIAVERGTAPHALPRAAHLDGTALQVLADAGAPVAHLGRPVDGFDLVDRRGRLLLRGRPAERPPPGQPSGVLIHQPAVERALRARLAELPTVEQRLGHAVERVRQSGDGVVVEGACPDGGFEIRAGLAVGCDGAGSRVREGLGIGLEGGGFEQAWLVVDVVLDRDLDLPQRLLQIADPSRPTTFVPFPGRRRRWEFRLRPGDDPDAIRQPDAVHALLAPHVDPGLVTVERAAVYTFHDLVATRWRQGRVLLAGDAAHQMPPFLGQGLGAGLRDAAALAPLLGEMTGGAGLSRLDGYERQRRAHVQATVRQAVRLGRLITLPEPWASVRDRALRAGLRVPGLRRRLLDVRG